MTRALYSDPSLYAREDRLSEDASLLDEARQPRIYRHIEGNCRCSSGGLTLHELFVVNHYGDDRDKDKLLPLLRRVTRRHIAAFMATTTVDRQGKRREKPGLSVVTDHFIPQMDGTVDGLVYYFSEQLKGKTRFVRSCDLPPQYRYLPRDQRLMARARARQLLLCEVVEELLKDSTKLWFHPGSGDGDGVWQASQSFVDEAQPRRRRRRRRGKPDERTFHGRPGKQGRQRAKQQGNPGASTGGVR